MGRIKEIVKAQRVIIKAPVQRKDPFQFLFDCKIKIRRLKIYDMSFNSIFFPSGIKIFKEVIYIMILVVLKFIKVEDGLKGFMEKRRNI
jgi:hypothetical protein